MFDGVKDTEDRMVLGIKKTMSLVHFQCFPKANHIYLVFSVGFFKRLPLLSVKWLPLHFSSVSKN